MLKTLRPDPTFYPSPRLAMEGPAENYAYVLMLSPDFSKPDGLAVVDVAPGSNTYGKIVHTVIMPNTGDEFHHFGWNACSSALSPLSGHAFLKRRFLIIPGIRSSRIYIIDTDPHPTQAKIHKIIEPEEVFHKTAYSRPHTVHCGPEGVYISTLGGSGTDGTGGPPGVFIMDCETFDILGRWEIDRGPQKLHYDFWWNLPRDYMVTSEWGLPPQYEHGVIPEDLLGNRYGHQIHFWDLRGRRHLQTIDLGANHQMALEVRPAHDPAKEYGFLGIVVDTTNLEGSIWTWWREGGKFHIEKSATIPPEAAQADLLPPLLKGFGAVPPLVTDIDLSLDDRFLYVACWGTGELRQYDVTDPRKPRLAGSVRVGGIVKHQPASERQALWGRPANDRDQQGRQTRLLYQLALLDLGRPVLSRGRARSAGDGTCWPDRRDRASDRLLCGVPRRLRRPPDSVGRGRLLNGLVLLSLGLSRSGMSATTVLWVTVAASGLYHGLNPGMGWPLAVAAGLTERREAAVVRTLVPLAVGHLFSITVVLLPFAALTFFLDWSHQIRIGAGLTIISFAAILLVYPRHPRFMARVRPTQIALWSFLIGLLHGAGLMLVPILLGLCTLAPAGALDPLASEARGLAGNTTLALEVALVHTAAMVGAGGLVAWAVYRFLGIKILTRSWFDLDHLWVGSLAVAGALGVYTAL